MAHVFSHLTCAALTDVGRKRKNNEDAFGRYLENGVFCVADGMGGAEDGEVASQAVVEGLAALCDRLKRGGRPYAGAAAQAWIAQALNDVSAWIYNRSEERGTRGTGSTFVGVCFDPAQPGTATALHAGDSRLYLLRKKTLTQITRDHSAAALAGVKDEKDLNPMFRGIVMRAVGVAECVELERTPFGVAEGDVVLLCSDGLTRMLEDKEILNVIRKAGDVEAAARALIDRANHNGGVDNVTVVLIRVGRLPDAAADCVQDLPGAAVPPDKAGERETRDTSRVDSDADSPRPYVCGIVTPSTTGSADVQPFEQATPTACDATPDTAKNTAAGLAETGTSPKRGKRVVVGSVAGGLLCLFVLARQVGWFEGNKAQNRVLPSASPEAVFPPAVKPEPAMQEKGVARPQATEDRVSSDRPAEVAARLAKEKAEAEAKAAAARLATEAAAREEAARKRVEDAQRLAKEKAEAAAKAEEARLAAEAAAREEAARKRVEDAQRLAKEKAEAAAKAEEARLAAEAAAREEAERKKKAEDAQRLAKEKAEATAARQKADEAQRLARENAQKEQTREAGLRQTFMRLAEDTAVLERFVTVAASFDDENARRTAKAVLAAAQAVTVFGKGVPDAEFDRPLADFIGSLANAAGFMDMYLDNEWLPRVSGLTQTEQSQAAERLVKQLEGLIKRRNQLGDLSKTAVRLDLHELVRMTAECVKQWQEIPGLAPARH